MSETAVLDPIDASTQQPDVAVPNLTPRSRQEAIGQRLGVTLEQAGQVELELVGQEQAMQSIDGRREGLRSSRLRELGVVVDPTASEEARQAAREKLLRGRPSERALLAAYDVLSVDRNKGDWMSAEKPVDFRTTITQLDSVKAVNPDRFPLRASRNVRQSLWGLRENIRDVQESQYFSVDTLPDECSNFVLQVADRLPAATLARLVELPGFTDKILTNGDDAVATKILGGLVKVINNASGRIASERLVGLLISARNEADHVASKTEGDRASKSLKRAMLIEKAIEAVGYETTGSDAKHTHDTVLLASGMRLEEEALFDANLRYKDVMLHSGFRPGISSYPYGRSFHKHSKYYDDDRRVAVHRGLGELYDDPQLRGLADKVYAEPHGMLALGYLADYESAERQEVMEYIKDAENPAAILTILNKIGVMQGSVEQGAGSETLQGIQAIMRDVPTEEIAGIAPAISVLLQRLHDSMRSDNVAKKFLGSDELYASLFKTTKIIREHFPNIFEISEQDVSLPMITLARTIKNGMVIPGKNPFVSDPQVFERVDGLRPLFEVAGRAGQAELLGKIIEGGDMDALFDLSKGGLSAEFIKQFNAPAEGNALTQLDMARLADDMLNHPRVWTHFELPSGINERIAHKYLMKRLTMKMPGTGNYIEAPSVTLDLANAFEFEPTELSDRMRSLRERELVSTLMQAPGIQKGTPGLGKKLDQLFRDPDTRRAYEIVLSAKKENKDLSETELRAIIDAELGHNSVFTDTRADGRKFEESDTMISDAASRLEELNANAKQFEIDKTRWFKEFFGTTIKAQDLSRAWQARPKALEDGVKDAPREIIRWARTNEFRQHIDVRRRRKEPTPTDQQLEAQEENIQELGRVYNGHTVYEAVEFMLAQDTEKAQQEALMQPGIVRVETTLLGQDGKPVYITDEKGAQVLDENEKPIEKKNKFKVELLRKDDVRGFTIGVDTGCCMRIGGASDDCMRAGFQDSRYGFLAVSLNDNIRAQSLLYVNPEDHSSDGEGSVLVIDNIEANAGTDQAAILKVYQDAIGQLIKQGVFKFKVKEVHLGTGYTAVSMAGLEDAQVVRTPLNVYSDAGGRQKKIPISL